MAEPPAPCDDAPMKQTSFASLEYAGKKRQTRREKFLGEKERVVPWAALIGLIEPHYPKSGRVGRPPNLFGHKRVHYRGLAKNGARMYSLFALANLVIAKRPLLRLAGVSAS